MTPDQQRSFHIKLACAHHMIENLLNSDPEKLRAAVSHVQHDYTKDGEPWEILIKIRGKRAYAHGPIEYTEEQIFDRCLLPPEFMLLKAQIGALEAHVNFWSGLLSIFRPRKKAKPFKLQDSAPEGLKNRA